MKSPNDYEPMTLSRKFSVVLFSAALFGCADSRSFWPAFSKQKPAPPSSVPDEPRPDVVALIRADPAKLFLGKITSVDVSEPTPIGRYWQFCARAHGFSVSGAALRPETYIVEVTGGLFSDKRKPTAGQCDTVRFEQIKLD